MPRSALISLIIGGALFVIFVAVVLYPHAERILSLLGPPYPDDWDVETIAYAEDDPKRPAVDRTWLIHREVELPDDFVLILTRGATGLPYDTFITDAATLRHAQTRAFVEHDYMSTASAIATAVFTLEIGLRNRTNFAYVGWEGEIHNSFACWWCAKSSENALPRDLAGLVEAGHPARYVTKPYSDKRAFAEALEKAANDPAKWLFPTATHWSETTERTEARGAISYWEMIQQ